jgi:hypothetical protein
MSTIREFAKKDLISAVSGFYEADDIRILRDALLKKRELSINTDFLVVRLDGTSSYTSGTGGFETYITTPLHASRSESRGLIETICKALLRNYRYAGRQQILFPLRMRNVQHWVTGQLLIEPDRMCLMIHDSSDYYKSLEIETILKDFFNSDPKNIQEFLNESGSLIAASHHAQLLEIIAARKLKNHFQFHSSRSKIFQIQRGGMYCGGFTTRLIIQLIDFPSANITERGIWDCGGREKGESELREEDAALVSAHARESDKKVFASRGDGRGYVGTPDHRLKEAEQQKSQKILLGKSKKILSETNKEVVKKLQQEILALRIDLLPINKIRSIYLLCINLGVPLPENPVAHFLQGEGVSIENKRIDTNVASDSLWIGFEALVMEVCSKSEAVVDVLPPHTASLMVGESSLEVTCISVKQIHAAKTKEKIQGYKGKSSVTDRLATKSTKGLSRSAKDKLPELQDTDHHIFRYKSDIGSLRKLLTLAQGEKSSEEFTRKDLEYVVACAEGSQAFSIVSRCCFNQSIKIMRLATQVLSYLSENKRKLSNEATQVLIKNLSAPDKKLSYYAIVALSYALNNGEDLSLEASLEESSLKILLEKIRALINERDFLVHLPIIIAGLSALALRKIKLSNSELNILKRSLIYAGHEDDSLSFFPATNVVKKKMPKSRIAFWRTTQAELGFIKGIARASGWLAENEIIYFLRRLEKGDSREKRKAVQILRHMIANQQRGFEDPKKIIENLELLGGDIDRKTKNNATLCMGYLVRSINSEDKFYQVLTDLLNTLLTPQRQYALSALNSYVQEWGSESVPDIVEWITVLRPLTTDKYETKGNRVKNTAQILLAELNNDVESITKLVLEKSYSVQATLLLVRAFERGHVRVENLETLEKLIKQDYPEEAKHNVLLILWHIAKSKHKDNTISAQTLETVLEYAEVVRNDEVLNIICQIIGAYAGKNLSNVPVPKALALLNYAISREAVRLNAISTVKEIIEALSDTVLSENFMDLLLYIVAVFNSTSDPQIKFSALHTLLHAAIKGFLFNAKILAHLAVSLNRKLEPIHQEKIFEIIKNLVEKHEDIFLPDNLLIGMTKLLQAGSDTLKNDVAYLVCQYLRKIKKYPPSAFIVDVCNVLEVPGDAYFSSQILKALVEKKWPFPFSLIESLSKILIKSDHWETRVNLAWILSELSEVHTFNSKTVTDCIDVLNEEGEILEYTVRALKKLSHRNNLRALTKEEVNKLAGAILSVDNQDVRHDVLFVLHKCRSKLSMEFLCKLIDVLEVSDEVLSRIIIVFLKEQMKLHHVWSRMHHTEIKIILQKIEQKILDLDLQAEVVSFIEEAHKCSYRLLKSTLTGLASVLMMNQCVVTRNSAANVLLSIKSSVLMPEEIKDIIQLEKYGNIFDGPSRFPDRKSALLHILEIVKKKQPLTQNNFQRFEKYIVNGTDEITSIIVAILYGTALLGQGIPLILLERLVKILDGLLSTKKADYDASFLKHAITLLVEVGKRGYCVPENTYTLLEELYLSNPALCSVADMLEMFKLIIKQRKMLKPASIEKVAHYLKDNNPNYQLAAAIILNQLSKLDTDLSKITSHIVARIVLERSGETIYLLIASLHRIVIRRPSALSITDINLLGRYLQESVNLRIVVELTKIIELMKTRMKQTKEMLKILAVRKREHVLMHENKLSKFVSILRALLKTPKFLSSAFFAFIEEALQGPVKRAQVILRCLNRASSKLIFPNTLLLALGKLYGESTCHKEVNIFLNQLVHTHKRFPLPLIKQLLKIMLYHNDISIRDQSLKILQKVLKYQKLTSRHVKLIESERLGNLIKRSLPTADNKNIKQFLEAIQAENMLISKNNFITMIELLGCRTHSCHLLVMGILRNAKERLPFLDREQVLDNLTIRIIHNPLHMDESIALCIELLQIPHFFPKNIPKLINNIRCYLIVNKLTSNILSLLNNLISRASREDIDHRLVKLLSAQLLKAPLEEQQHRIADLIFLLIRKNALIISEFLKPSMKLAEAICQPPTSGEKNKVCLPPSVRIKVAKILSYAYRSNIKGFKEIETSLLEVLSEGVVKHVFKENRAILTKFDTMTSDKKINLFCTILSVEYFDLNVFDYYIDNSEIYVREILCQDLLNHSIRTCSKKYFEQERKYLYQCLSDFEEARNYKVDNEERDNILALIAEKQARDRLSLEAVNHLLIVFKSYDFTTIRLLSESHENLKLYWLNTCLSKLNILDSTSASISIILKQLDELNWDIVLVDKFFKKVAVIDGVVDIQKFLDFVIKFQATQKMVLNTLLQADCLVSENFSILECWRISLEKQILSNVVDEIVSVGEQEVFLGQIHKIKLIQGSFKTRILQLTSNGWSFVVLYEYLQEVLTSIKQGQECNFESLYSVFDVAYCYSLKEQVIYETLKKEKLEEVATILHGVGVRFLLKTDLDAEDKDLSQLLTEFLNTNTVNPLIAKAFNVTMIQKFLELSKVFYSGKNKLPSGYASSLPIDQWKPTEIQSWATYIKDYANNAVVLPEIIAVVKRACGLAFEDLREGPRKAQLLTLLTFVYTSHDQGRLAEVFTGEGKSLSIAMFAILKSLQGQKVDVVTSASYLAKRDADHFRKFYHLFNLNVGNNLDKGYVRGLKRCYADDVHIVYGAINDFQFDLLRDEYSRLGTRGRRPFEVVIVDEVDNLLIDEGSKIAMLANGMPGMDNLKPLLMFLWFRFQQLKGSIFKKGTDYYYQAISASGQFEYQKINIFSFIEEKLLVYSQIILKENPHLVPIHLLKFYEVQLKKWIKQAYLADFHHHHNQAYTLKRNQYGALCVTPVDFANTGTIQNGTTWGDGLHQFLQMKHGLEMTSESLVVNFISNMAFIKRYKNNLYGLTGTLGSSEAQKLLKDVYNIDFAHIPSYRPRCFYELPGILASAKQEWLFEVKSSAKREAEQGRVVLVICETMQEARIFSQQLKQYRNLTVKSYTGHDNEHLHFLKTDIEGGTIIIATNIAGRGTDIKLSPQVKGKGGLHVCFTFLPQNLRVEIQGFGRAARAGVPGTAQLVLNLETVSHKLPLGTLKGPLNFQMIKKLRDEEEQRHLTEFREKELPKTWTKDYLYENFCLLLKKIFEKDPEVPSYKIKAIEERFGVWLKEIETETSEAVIHEKFAIFQKNILEDLSNDTVVQNPYYYINHGCQLIIESRNYSAKIWENFSHDIYRRTIDVFDKAISLDPIYAYMAHYNKIYALIKMRGPNYKEQAKFHAMEVTRIVTEFVIPKLHVISQAIQSGAVDNESRIEGETVLENEIAFQLNAKIQSLDFLLNSTKKIVSAIEESQKLIDVVFETEDSQTYYRKLKKEEALTAVHFHDGSLSVCFHNLSSHSDVTTHYQARNTLKRLSIEARVSIIFELQDDKEKLKSLLPINRLQKEDVEHEKSKEVKETSETQVLSSDKKKVSTRDYLTSLTEGVSNLASKVSAGISSVVAPINDICHSLQDKSYKYKTTETLGATLKLKYLDLAEIQKTILHLEKGSNVSLILDNIQEELAKAILDSPYSAHIKMSESAQTIRSGLKGVIQTSLRTFKKGGTLCFKDIATTEIAPLIAYLVELIKNNLPILPQQPEATLILPNLSQESAEKLIETSQGLVTLAFEDLEKEDAVKVIEITGKYNREAIFNIKNLTHEEAERIITRADRKEQHFTVSSKPIEELVLKLKKSKDELHEYQSSGLICVIDIVEQNPMPWRSITVVTILGIIQIATGIALMGATFGFGANFGAALIAEGIGDILRGFMGMYTRQFSWGSYVAQKAVSLAISLATAGMATANLSQANTVSAELLDDLAMQSAIALNKKAAQDGFKTAGLKFLEKTLEKTATSATNVILDVSVEHGMKHHLAPCVNESVNDEMLRCTQNGVWSEMLSKIFAIDYFLEREFLTSGTLAQELLLQAKGIVGTIHVGTIGVEILFSYDVFPEFYQKFSRVLNEKVQNLPTFERLLHQKVNCVPKDFEKACKVLRDQNIISKEGHLDLHLDTEERAQKMEFLKPRDEEEEDYRDTIVMACNEFVDINSRQFYVEKRAFSEKLALLFSEQQLKACGVFVGLAKQAVSKVASWGVQAAVKGIVPKVISSSQPKTDDGPKEEINDSSPHSPKSKEGPTTHTKSSSQNSHTHDFQRVQLEPGRIPFRPIRHVLAPSGNRHAHSEGVTDGRVSIVRPINPILSKVGEPAEGAVPMVKVIASSELKERVDVSLNTVAAPKMPPHPLVFSRLAQVKAPTATGNEVRVSTVIRDPNSISPKSNVPNMRMHDRVPILPKAGEKIVVGAASKRAGTGLPRSVPIIIKREPPQPLTSPNRLMLQAASKLDKNSKASHTSQTPSHHSIDLNTSTLEALEGCVSFSYDCLVKKYEIDLDQAYAKRKKILIDMGIKTARQNETLYMALLDEERNIIGLLIGFIIVEKQISHGLANLTTLKFEEGAYKKSLENKAHSLYYECMQDPENGYYTVVNGVNEIPVFSQKIDKLMRKLKEAFTSLHGLLKANSDVVGVLTEEVFHDTSLHETVDKVIKDIKHRNYSQCTSLMRTGKLGMGGVIAGCLVEGIMKSHLESIEAHAQFQILLMGVVKVIVTSQSKLKIKVLTIEQRRAALVSEAFKKISDDLAATFTLVKTAIEQKKQAQGKSQIEVEQAAKTFKEAKDACILIRVAHSSIVTISERYKLDYKVISDCLTICENEMQNILDLAQKLGTRESINFEELIARRKAELLNSTQASQVPTVEAEPARMSPTDSKP